jgi:hypothetical protein
MIRKWRHTPHIRKTNRAQSARGNLGRNHQQQGGKVMTTIFDVAKYILQQRGEMTAMKLQKLCYYAQAWSLAWAFSRCDFDHPEWGLSTNQDRTGEIFKYLSGLERQKWHEIIAATSGRTANTRNHFITKC